LDQVTRCAQGKLLPPADSITCNAQACGELFATVELVLSLDYAKVGGWRVGGWADGWAGGQMGGRVGGRVGGWERG
jgi:hypothetical protein